jgi:copper transport protein
VNLRRPGAVALLVLIGVLVAAPPAGAHARLVATSPEAGTTVPEPPRELRLEFNEPIDISPGAVRLFDAAGRQIDLPEATRSPEDPKVVVTRPPTLERGSYVVAWRAVSADGHPISGAFTFSVIEPGGSTRSLVDQLVNEQGSPTVGVLVAVARWLGFASVLLLIGAAGFVAICQPDAAGAPRVRRWIGTAVVVGVVASLAAFALHGPYSSGAGIGRAFSPDAWADVAATRLGRAHLLRVLFLLGWLPLVRRTGLLTTTPGRMLAAAGSVALAVTVAESGHAVTGRWPLLAWGADIVHVLAAAIWTGGLVALLGIGLRDADRALPAARRFSSLALAAVVVVTLTGVVQSVRQVGDWSALTSTTFGRLLLVKVGLVLVIVAVAWVSRSILRLSAAEDAELPTPVARTYLRRSVAVEVLGVVAVLIVTTLVTSVVPAREAAGLPFEQTVVAEGGFAQILVDPARSNVESALHVTVSNPDGTLPDLRGVEVELRLPERDLGPIQVTLERVSLNHFINESVVFPFPGSWEVTAKVAVTEFRNESFSLTVPVR